MRTIEIITHCWAVKDWRYAAALNYQLSSLVLNKPKNARVFMTVCYSLKDKRTASVLEFFSTWISIHGIILSEKTLFRRAIGRNAAGMASVGDIIWFADADYCFGDGALDYLAEIQWNQGESVIYPNQVKISTNHQVGDYLLGLAKTPHISSLSAVANWNVEKYSRAIGGCQIVEGSFARGYGYLQNTKYQKPSDVPFGNKGKGTHTPDDIAYRKFCQQHGIMKGVDIPNLYRIRHSEGLPNDQMAQTNS